MSGAFPLPPKSQLMASDEVAPATPKLRLLLIPFFATGHIIPYFDFARNLVAAHPAVEPTLVLSPANAALIRSSLLIAPSVQLLTYTFPAAELHLPPGAENIASVPSSDAWKLEKAVNLVRATLDPIIHADPPDAIIADFHYWWALHTAHDLGIPCLTFSVIGAFPHLVLRSVARAGRDDDPVDVPGLPGPPIVIPRSELPARTSGGDSEFEGILANVMEAKPLQFGAVVNTFSELEPAYCDFYRTVYKRAWFVGPVAAAGGASCANAVSDCITWLDVQKPGSVVYVCFGSWCHFSNEQLRELAVGLEAAAKPFLWVVRGGGEEWLPEGWEGRVSGMLVREWAPQAAILKHAAVGAFLTHCGWNSVLEAVTAGVAMLTWPLVFEQFINEKLVVGVMGVGERLWGGFRSTEESEKVVVPGEAIGKAVAAFMEDGGEAARQKAKEYKKMAKAAVAEGGSSNVDLNSMLEVLMVAASSRGS